MIDFFLFFCFSSADCIANYNSQLDNKQGVLIGSDSAVYSDVDLSNKLNEMKTFNNPSMCYMGPGGSPPTPYEPTPYATTQLIQSNIMSKNSGAGPGDFCDKRWKPQQPKPPDLPSQLQFNIMEQNRLNKGERLKQYSHCQFCSLVMMILFVMCISCHLKSCILRSLQRR